MRGCQLTQDGDRLTIRPTAGTMFAPIAVCGVLGTGVAVAVFRLAQLPAADVRELLSEPMTWVYTVLSVGLLGAAVAWYFAASNPIALNRGTNELETGSRREPLVGAVAVAVRVDSGSDSDDSYHIEIVFADRRLDVGRVGWADEPNRAVAEANATRIAKFLGVPAEFAVVS